MCGCSSASCFFGLGLVAAIGGSFAPAREAASISPASRCAPEIGGLRILGKSALSRYSVGCCLRWRRRSCGCLREKSCRGRGTRRSPACSSARCWSRPALARTVLDRLPAGGPAWRQIATAQLRGTARTHGHQPGVGAGEREPDGRDGDHGPVLPRVARCVVAADPAGGSLPAGRHRRLVRVLRRRRAEATDGAAGRRRIDFLRSTEVSLRDGAAAASPSWRDRSTKRRSAQLLPLRRVADGTRRRPARCPSGCRRRRSTSTGSTSATSSTCRSVSDRCAPASAACGATTSGRVAPW